MRLIREQATEYRKHNEPRCFRPSWLRVSDPRPCNPTTHSTPQKGALNGKAEQRTSQPPPSRAVFAKVARIVRQLKVRNTCVHTAITSKVQAGGYQRSALPFDTTAKEAHMGSSIGSPRVRPAADAACHYVDKDIIQHMTPDALGFLTVQDFQNFPTAPGHFSSKWATSTN